jgi:hypothetical protein
MAQVDAATAVRKLQNNQPLTDAEKKLLGMSVTSTETPVEENETLTTAVEESDPRYYTVKVGSTGKTSAQLNAAANAANVAKSVGGTIDPKTGYVLPASDGASNEADGLTPAERQAAAAEEARKLNEKRDAFALIQSTMKDYGFTDEEYTELLKYIEGALINPKIGPNQMVLELRKLPTYKARFAGNETRLKNGLNTLSEANYIQQENSYAEYLTAGGVSKLGTRATYAKLIGGAVSPTEVGKRVNMAVDRVTTADPEIMKMIRRYNPQISQQDLVSYFLDPENTLPELEKKVSMGEIGTAASQAGLDYNYGRIEDLQQYGVTREQAIVGYGNIGQVLPVAEKLGDVYSESGIRYDQATGESEFFKSNASAMEKRRRLASLERGAFSASAGLAQGALSSGSTKSSATAGLI